MKADYAGACSRCHSTLSATVELASTGDAKVDPALLIGVYCNCPESPSRGPAGPRAVVLTLMVAV